MYVEIGGGPYTPGHARELYEFLTEWAVRDSIYWSGSRQIESGKQDVKKEPTAPIGVDSSERRVETDRYEKQQRPNHLLQDLTDTRQDVLKILYYSISGHQIILAPYTTPSNASVTSMLPYMVNFLVKNHTQIEKRLFNGDKGYDSDQNYKTIFNANMKPNIKQRNHTDGAGHTNRGKPPSKKKAAGIFDKDAYKQRTLIETIWSSRRDKESQTTWSYTSGQKQKAVW